MATYQAQVLYEYTAQDDEQLTIKPGEIVTIIDESDELNGWALAQKGDREGYIPVEYVRKGVYFEDKSADIPVNNMQENKSADIGDVSAVGVFVDDPPQMILKVFPEQEMESAFRAAYKDFKSQCLSFLKQVEEKDDLEIRHYTISEPYTMFCHDVDDKEIVFLMAGDHLNGFPVTDALHQAVIGIINSIHASNRSGNGGKGHGFSSIEELFRTMDLDGNGTIDHAEFTEGLGVLGVDWKDSKIKILFNQIDEEGNSEISLEAFMRFMMTHSNKSSWKQLKAAINASLHVPRAKYIKDSTISPELYQKKLSQIERLVNMMEDAVVELQLPSKQQQYWKNKILAHREFIRAHQDAVGKAMSSDNAKLKKKLSDLEKKNRRLGEFAVSMGIDPENYNALKKAKQKGGKRLVSGSDEDKEALIRRLRRDGDELRWKIQAQQGDLRRLKQRVSMLEDEKKQHEMTVNDLKQQIKELKIKALDVNNFMEWDSNDVLNWILSIENNVFRKYEQKLKEEIMEGEISGSDLDSISMEDIKGLGITKFAHRKLLHSNIQKLTQINKNKQNVNDVDNEGINPPTAYI